MGTGVDTSHCDTSHCARPGDGRSTNARGGVLQSRRSRRARAEARAPMRGSSRVCRGVWRSRRCPARCAALRGAARRRGGGGAARSSCAAAGCWCPAPAPPPSRGRCAQQPRAAGALCPLRRRAAGRAVAATAAPPLRATPSRPDSARARPRTRPTLFRGRANTAGNDSAPRQPPRAASAADADDLSSSGRTSHRFAFFCFSPASFLGVSTVFWSGHC